MTRVLSIAALLCFANVAIAQPPVEAPEEPQPIDPFFTELIEPDHELVNRLPPRQQHGRWSSPRLHFLPELLRSLERLF